MGANLKVGQTCNMNMCIVSDWSALGSPERVIFGAHSSALYRSNTWPLLIYNKMCLDRQGLKNHYNIRNGQGGFMLCYIITKYMCVNTTKTHLTGIKICCGNRCDQKSVLVR